MTIENCWITIFQIQEARLRKSDNLKPLFSRNEELCVSKKGKIKCSCIRRRANHAHQKQLPQKISMRVMTSQYVISGKITFAQLKRTLQGIIYPPDTNKQHFARGKSWHFHTALWELRQTSLYALRTETSFWFHYDWPEIQIWLWMNNHTDNSYLSQKERAFPSFAGFLFLSELSDRST